MLLPDTNKTQRENARWVLQKNATCSCEQIMVAASHKAADVLPLTFHLENYLSKTNKTCEIMLDEQGQIYERHFLIDCYTRTSQWWPTIKNLHTSALCGHWMRSRGPTRNGRRLCRIARERVRELRAENCHREMFRCITTLTVARHTRYLKLGSKPNWGKVSRIYYFWTIFIVSVSERIFLCIYSLIRYRLPDAWEEFAFTCIW